MLCKLGPVNCPFLFHSEASGIKGGLQELKLQSNLALQASADIETDA